MTLLHETLLQSAPDQKDDIDQDKITSVKQTAVSQSPSSPIAPPPGLAAPVKLQAAVSPPPGLESSSGCFSALTQELVKVAAEISRIDGMMQKLQADTPEAAEAVKWQKISMCALRWSRDSLTERQQGLLVQLRELTLQQMQARPGVPAPEPSAVSDPEPEPAHEPEPRSGSEHVGSLRNDLDKLRTYERDCVLHVRNIKKLGVRSPEKLQAHFSRFGELADVLVAHSFEKPTARRRQGRVRPAALGFIVFQSSAVAEAVLAAGAEHFVGVGEDAVAVQVHRYEPMDLELLSGKEAMEV